MVHEGGQRVSQVEAGSDPDFDALAADMVARGVHVSNLARTLGRQPVLMRAAGAHSAALSHDTSLPAVLVELAICRTAIAAGGAYPLSHHAPKAIEAGLDEAKLGHVADLHPGLPFTDVECAVMRAVDEIEAGQGLSDQVADDIFERLSEVQVLELVQLVAYYSGLVRIVAALRIPVDEDKQTWVDRYWPKSTTDVS